MSRWFRRQTTLWCIFPRGWTAPVDKGETEWWSRGSHGYGEGAAPGQAGGGRMENPVMPNHRYITVEFQYRIIPSTCYPFVGGIKQKSKRLIRAGWWRRVEYPSCAVGGEHEPARVLYSSGSVYIRMHTCPSSNHSSIYTTWSGCALARSPLASIARGWSHPRVCVSPSLSLVWGLWQEINHPFDVGSTHLANVLHVSRANRYRDPSKPQGMWGWRWPLPPGNSPNTRATGELSPSH